MQTLHSIIILLSILFIVITGLSLIYIYVDHVWRPKAPKTRINTYIKDKTTYYYRSEFYRPILGWKGFNAYLCTGKIIRDNTWYEKPTICNKSIKAYKLIKIEGVKTCS